MSRGHPGCGEDARLCLYATMLPLYYFGKYKLACSTAFELAPTHLRTTFSWRERLFILVLLPKS